MFTHSPEDHVTISGRAAYLQALAQEGDACLG